MDIAISMSTYHLPKISLEWSFQNNILYSKQSFEQKLFLIHLSSYGLAENLAWISFVIGVAQ